MIDITQIHDKDDLNKALNDVYSDRNYYEFMYGKDFFIQQVNKVWANEIKYMIRPKHKAFLITPDFLRVCWEIDNDYSRPE